LQDSLELISLAAFLLQLLVSLLNYFLLLLLLLEQSLGGLGVDLERVLFSDAASSLAFDSLDLLLNTTWLSLLRVDGIELLS